MIFPASAESSPVAKLSEASMVFPASAESSPVAKLSQASMVFPASAESSPVAKLSQASMIFPASAESSPVAKLSEASMVFPASAESSPVAKLSQANIVFPSSVESSPEAKSVETFGLGVSAPAAPPCDLNTPEQTALVPTETPCGELAEISDAMQKALDLKKKADALAASGAPGSAYMQYLAQKAEEAARSGYAIKQATRTVRKTQVNKTRVVTDVRTGEQTTENQSTTFIDEWYEEGAPKVTGTGIFLARGRKSSAEYSDGSVEVQQQKSRADSMFWAGTFEDGPTHVQSYDDVDIDGLVARAAARAKLSAQ